LNLCVANALSNLQIISCHKCHTCHECRRPLHAIARWNPHNRRTESDAIGAHLTVLQSNIGPTTLSRRKAPQEFRDVDDFCLSVSLQHKQVFIARYKNVGPGDSCQRKKIVVVRISTDSYNLAWAKQFCSSQEIGERIRVGRSDKFLEGSSSNDFGEFLNRRGRS